MSSIDQGSRASHALLTAALGGLLSVAACSQSGYSITETTEPAATGDPAVPDTATTQTNGDTPVPATQCDGGVSPDPQVTTTTVAALTQDQFVAQCDARSGIFEVQPHCGGSNSCRGMSYDANTQTLTEHSCRATNTCAGFSCVVCD